MAVEIKLHGVAELKKQLETLTPRLTRKVMMGALRDGAKLFRDEARQRVPVLTGTVRRNIYMRPSKVDKPGYFVAVRRLSAQQIRRMKMRQAKGKGRAVGPDPADPFYWRFVEFGFTHTGGRKVAARPFMRGAFEAQQRPAVDLIIQRIRERLEDVNRTAGRAL